MTVNLCFFFHFGLLDISNDLPSQLSLSINNLVPLRRSPLQSASFAPVVILTSNCSSIKPRHPHSTRVENLRDKEVREILENDASKIHVLIPFVDRIAYTHSLKEEDILISD
ncbi:hypothetical protein GQ457_05G012130 [Hibiscus cannabinus]